METITYKKAGVDPEKAGRLVSSFARYLRSRPHDKRLLAGIGPFAACFSLKHALKKLTDPILVSSCDGVGTKLLLAKEWGGLDSLGIDLVAMNVNDLLCMGATPLVFLDYFACGSLEPEQWTVVLKGIQRGCEDALCTLVGGETAEMPGLYASGDFDLAGFTVGIMDRNAVLGARRIKPKDKLFAVESSGLHSNGYSLVRKIVEREKIDPNAMTPFSARTWKKCLLAPTHIYVQPMLPFLKQVHALAHLTGGGLFENLPRILPAGFRAVLSAKAWNIPPLFLWLGEKAGLTTQQLLSTFNCGVGMVIVSDDNTGRLVEKGFKKYGMRVWEIGKLEKVRGGSAQVLWE
ncbi:MAG: phosphoribosylformylglycinamidine cyclo-ligase [Deltaproteobacteria bacterium]|nr:phosphoribosylformylglycinamidine cyclo-ligase [Deltaproteobacteria bacterium]